MNASADRSVLTNASIGSIAETLSAMNQVERAGLYVGLIRFLGILWADVMRAITIAENNDDMEALVQTSMRFSTRLTRRTTGMPRAPRDYEDTNLMQTLAKTTATTFFGSRMAMLQAHFESVEVQQANQISRSLQAKLSAWKNEWTMGLRSVSRDRVERFSAVLAAYETEDDEGVAQGRDSQWADDQWANLEEHLAIDAHKLTDRVECDIIENDTLPNTQAGGTAPEVSTLVRRTPHGPWERASAKEEAELRAHDEEEARLRDLQRQHDEQVWNTMQKQKEEEKKARALLGDVIRAGPENKNQAHQAI